MALPIPRAPIGNGGRESIDVLGIDRISGMFGIEVRALPGGAGPEGPLAIPRPEGPGGPPAER